jgi:hypothetical protein
MKKEVPSTGALVVVVVAILGTIFFLNYAPNNQKEVRLFLENKPTVTAVPFTKLIQGAHSSVTRRVNYFVTSQTELEQVWKMIRATGTLPKINFKTTAVIAIFAGSEVTSEISVTKIEDSDSRLVSIALTKPSGTCENTKQKLSAYQIVTVPMTSLPLAHKDAFVATTCAN